VQHFIGRATGVARFFGKFENHILNFKKKSENKSACSW
jgi:hypothetical protein